MVWTGYESWELEGGVVGVGEVGGELFGEEGGSGVGGVGGEGRDILLLCGELGWLGD